MKHQVRWRIFRKPNPKLRMLWTPSISSKSLRYALGFTTSSRINRWSNTEGPDWSHHGCATWISPSSKGASSQGGLGSVMICLDMDVKILENCYSKIFRKNMEKWSQELGQPLTLLQGIIRSCLQSSNTISSWNAASTLDCWKLRPALLPNPNWIFCKKQRI